MVVNTEKNNCQHSHHSHHYYLSTEPYLFVSAARHEINRRSGNVKTIERCGAKGIACLTFERVKRLLAKKIIVRFDFVLLAAHWCN